MWTSMDSPVGELRIIANRTAITAIEFAGPAPAGASPHSSMSRAAAVSLGRPVGDRDDAHPLLVEAVRQLRAYFDGELKEFDLPLEPAGTPFQLSVWEQLRGIGYGETASYGAVAARLGMRPAASRAVGLANGRNPIPIVIPCHRVVGANGTLTGYAGGVERKQQLLDLEQGALF
ncbi:methylated-DNA--[Nocardioides sp. WL0053]|jgi:methylated-DNA-[protein]-cysteine S-methyltransferase|uniref:Methylated-DNA--protein-cysteine methyltransferase n=1 Tax=Nocardioides jiangsuensis TaxID=2866161 RepID=A0ABS7RP82_9ACTN|nr:methylated-DNA--[protein]-cysteine S-methyltransferase [Nocardioides jiangsuensis]MBY9075730.1 methylated-DNA--[protein]-cysteine S-methyltransferase [Nocardioides jiangsuensis]